MRKAYTLTCLCLFFAAAVIAQQRNQSYNLSTESYNVIAETKEKTAGVKAPHSKLYPYGFETGPEFRKLYAPGGPYDYINPDAEILDSRGEGAKHFLRSDGKVSAVTTAGPVHYKKGGLWNTILNDIYPNSAFSGFSYAATHNRFQTYFGNSLQGGIRIVTESNEQLNLMQNAGIKYLDKNFAAVGGDMAFSGNVAATRDNTITYANILPGAGALIEQNSAGYELSYELQNLSAFNIPLAAEYVSFCEGIKVPAGYHAIVENDGAVVKIVNAEGRILFKYKAPVFYEKNDPGNSVSRTGGKYFTEEANGIIYLHVLVPVKWLTDSHRSFPVVIDPVVTVTPINSFSWTFTVDNDNGCDFSTDNDADDNMRVGFDDGFFDDDDYQCFAQYDISSIPTNACIQHANVRWYQWNFVNGNTSDNNMHFYFQAYDPITTDAAAVVTCDQNYNEINLTSTKYRYYNLWASGTPNPPNTMYDNHNTNVWIDFSNQEVGPRVKQALNNSLGFVVFSIDNNPEFTHYDDGVGQDNDEYWEYRGYTDVNRPQLVIDYETPFVAASTITATNNPICNGAAVTLTRFDGTAGSVGNWAWYNVSAGSAFLGYGNSVTVTPGTTTTYCLRGENICGNTNCTQYVVTVVADPSVSASGSTTICLGGSTTLTATPAGGLSCSTVSWESSPNGAAPWTATGLTGNSISVSPASSTYYRAVYACSGTGCNPNPATSSPVLVVVNTPSSPPSSVSATSTTICNGQTTQLSVTGTLGTGANWRWYAGGCGAGSPVGMGSNVNVAPTTTTTYYVRAEGPTPCATSTTCLSITITVNQPSTAPTGITGTSTICNGDNTTLTRVGGSLGTGADWVWYAGSCGGTQVGTGSSIIVSPGTTTTYYVRAEGPAPCATTTACASITVTVNTLSTAPTSVIGTTTICQGITTALTANGGSPGTGASYFWYSGSCGGTFVGNGATINVSPSTTTTYFVRLQGTCNTTPCAAATVTVNDTSVPATSISGSSAVCIGNSTLLTAVGGHLGVNASWHWYSGSCGGTAVGTNSPVTVSPVTTTTYFLRAEGLCNNTICRQLTVTVNPLPNGSISGTSTICSGSFAVLTFNFSTGTAPFNIVYTDGSNLFAKNGVNNGDTVHVSPGTTSTYTFNQISDFNGCTRTSGFLGGATVTVAPLPLVGNVAVTNVSCNGGNNGTIILTGTSGTPPYQFALNGGTPQPSGTFNGLTAGSYTAAISDAFGCTTTYGLPIVVTEPPVLTQTDSVVNASCANVFDASITVNASGGTAPYTYSINNGPTQNSNVFAGLASGTYVVQVTDSKGCVDTAQVAINNSYAVTGSLVSKNNVSCFGGADGAITVQLSGGVAPYTYSKNGVLFQPTGTFTGLTAGVYTIILRDSKGCTDFVTDTITQPNLLQAAIDSLHTIGCSGDSTGAIYISVSGGTAPYAFNWSNGSITEDITGVPAGTYNVAIVDSHGCTTSIGATLSQPIPLFANIASAHNLRCYQDSTGSVDITVSGGTPPYNFAWNNGETTEDIFNKGAGTYSVTITDGNGCQQVLTQTLTEPAQLTSTISATSVSCAGGANAAVNLTVSGGTPGYSYLWSNGATSQDLNNVGGGSYSVIITDANSCTAANSVFVSQPAALALSTVAVNNLCGGDSVGSISVIVSGGTMPYTYLWSTGDTTQNIDSLQTGTYTVTVTDGNGCTAVASHTLTSPAPINSVTAGIANVSCNGGIDGAIDINVFGGVPFYTYQWSNSATSEDLNNIPAGTYNVTVTDANGCTATVSATVSEPAALSTSISAVNVTCAGALNGSISFNVSGGTPGYAYLWSTGDTTQNLTGIAGGNYSVIVTDAAGCTATNSINVAEPAAINIAAVVTNVICGGDSSGTIDLTVTGGTGNFTFIWSNGAVTEDLNSLPTGNYTVTVTDGSNCSVSAGYTIQGPQPFVVVLAGSTNVSCFGGNNGTIDINVFGGTPLYSYLWNNGSTTEDINSLLAGTYNVTVTDANSCSVSFSTVITEPSALTTAVTSTNVTCPGASNGSADLTVGGGTGPYSYLWSNGATTEDLSNVTGGTYTVIVTDANGCTAGNSVTIQEGQPLSITGVITNVLCNGDSSGAVDITVTGGTGAYTYNWSNGTTAEDLLNVPAGVYTVTAGDANSCSASASFTVAQPAGIILSATPINVACAGGNNGSIDLTVYGGIFPYTYLWNNTDTTEDLHGIAGGTYTVTVTDANGCTISRQFTITEPGAITTSIVVTNVTCYGADNGAADLTVTGGATPYNFLWSTFQGSEDVSGLGGGLYYVIVTDNNGCEVKDSVFITEPAPLALTTAINSISCYNANDGAVDLTVTGGTVPYAYAWSNGDTTQDLQNLQSGTYVVTVTDGNGCTATTSVTIINPSTISANFFVHNPLCFGSTDGSIDLIPAGGTLPYNFSWSTGDTTEDIANIAGGTYIVTITDSKGCVRIDSATAVEPSALYTSGVVKNVSCAGAGDGNIIITSYGGTLPYNYAWSQGASTKDIYNVSGGNYYVTTTDGNGCQAVSLYIIVEPDSLTISLTSNNVLCNGDKSATITAHVAGGTVPYNYLWSNFVTDSAVLGAGAGHYVVQLIDSNGCMIYDSVTITEPAILAVSGVVTHVLCYNDNTGAVNITVTGGTTPYTFAWTGGNTSEDLNGLVAGTYAVTVTDANGCRKVDSFTVEQGPEIIPGIAAIHPVCYGGNSGSLTAIVTGGTAPYDYTWSNNETTIAISNLSAGTYTLTVGDSRGCAVTATATLNNPQQLQVSTSASGSKCFNSATGKVVASVTGGTPPYTYLLNGMAQSTDTFTGLLPGNYIIVVTDANGCQATSSFVVSSPTQISVSLGATQSVILTGMETQLVATATSDTTIIHYFWEPDSVVNYSLCGDPANCASPYAKPLTTTTFTVTVMNADSCTASDTITITVNNEYSQFIPNSFSPNGDGLNDRFEFDFLGATAIQVAVFDRWGERVYYNPAQQNGFSGTYGWDGTKNGKLCPFDTYVYQLKVTYYDGTVADKSGTITIMR